MWEASELIYSVFIESLRDDFVITISRLTDNASTGKNGINKNSTLYRLRDDLEQLQEQRLRDGYYDESLLVDKLRKEKGSQRFEEFKLKLGDLENNIKDIKKFRDKKKAHRDLESIIEEYQRQKEGDAKDDLDPGIKNSIETIQEILNLFSSIAFHTTTLGGIVFQTPKGTEYFIKNLEEGNKWRKGEIERMTKKLNENI